MKAKTCDIIANWMKESCDEVKMEYSDFSQLTADGGSNAIGSVVEFEFLTRDKRESSIEFNICLAHQVSLIIV